MTLPSYLEDQLISLPGTDRQRTLRIWNPTGRKALIVGIHGGMSHSGDYATVGEFFKSRDIVTLSVDLAGHGEQKRILLTDFDAFLDDVEAMLEFAATRFPALPVFITGHSMGGLIAAHFALSERAQRWQVRGMILSSPYFANAIPVPRVLVVLSGILSTLLPRAKVPMESVTNVLTRDPEITMRHHQDEALQRRASEASFGFGHALLEAQARLRKHGAWKQLPVFAAIAGNDKLADSAVAIEWLKKIDGHLLTLRHFPEHFHENFNEPDRDLLFADILAWMNALLEPALQMATGDRA
mgnify:CR=1 FL=1